jgi:hypothetical protein
VGYAIRARAAALMTAALVATGASACADTSDDEGGGVPTTAPAAEQVDRPVGSWHLVAWETERSDAPDAPAGVAEESILELTPACQSGACDVAVEPGGVDGTYRPEGVPASDGESPSEGYTFAWDEASATYTAEVSETVSCTNVDPDDETAVVTVDDAYDVTTTTTVRFVPPDGETPAAMVGTVDEVITSTPAGEEAGCTPYEASGSVVLAPTDAFTIGAEPDLAGDYVVTEVVEEVEPAGQREPGFTGLLGEVAIEGTDEGYDITGALETSAALVPTEAGWAGRSDELVGRTCGEVDDAFSVSETWTDLRPVALTEDGEPVLVGRWRMYDNPTPAGADAGCWLSVNTGSVTLVPTEAVS